MATGQQGQRLLDAVQRLPVSLRQVVTLALEGLSYAEIGDVLGITETNVGARLTRARQRLRQLL
jgi:RNA polymerase sigma-70 factor (ECF subfamily)